MASSMRADELRVAVAIGATTAEAVAMDARDRVLAQAEVATGGDLASVLPFVIGGVVGAPGIEPALVKHVMLGTGPVMTRSLEDGDLQRVAVIRIGSPLTHAIPPLSGWPSALRAAVSAGEVVVAGGAEYDGTVTEALDRDEIARFLGTLDEGVDSVAITGVFSPVVSDHELAAAAVVQQELGPYVRVSLSHELGTLGLIERENAAVLNAALSGAADRVASIFERALRAQRIVGEPFVSQNDGALMALALAQRLPVLMLDSGPANAIRGAVHLTGVGDAVVVNAAGAATEIATVVHGLAREAVYPVEVAGVRIGLRRPDVRYLRPDANVGALAEAVGLARAELRDPAVLAVGRAGRAVPDRLPGVGRVLHPSGGETAAAVGAAIAEVSARAERTSADRPDRRKEALDAAREAAIGLAVLAGADPNGLQVIAVDEAPLIYDVAPMVRIAVKVAGPPA